jgi:hypothetical protein
MGKTKEEPSVRHDLAQEKSSEAQLAQAGEHALQAEN